MSVSANNEHLMTIHNNNPNRSLYAVAGLTCGLAAIFPFLGLLFVVPAIVLGVLGIREVRRTVKTGKWLSIIGIALGVSGVFVSLLLASQWIPDR